MRGRRHHTPLAVLTLTAAIALAGCGGDGDSGDSDDKASPSADPRQSGSQGGGARDGAIPAKGVVVTAWCTVPASSPARVTVEAWDPTSWKPRGRTEFTLPAETALREDDARTPVAELCKRNLPHTKPSGKGPDPIPEPSVRQVFDDDYSRMAVVLHNRETESTRAAVVTPDGKATKLTKESTADYADAPGEMHPLFTPGSDGKEVWFVSGTDEDKRAPKIASVRLTGSKVSKPVPHGTGNTLRGDRRGFSLGGRPVSAFTAKAVTFSPDGRRAAGFQEMQGVNVVDVPRNPLTVRDGDATLYPLPSSCRPWGWTDSTTVLCGDRSIAANDPERANNFWTVDAGSLREDEDTPEGAAGDPILPTTKRENTPRALSADGGELIFTSRQGSRTEHFRVATTPGSTPKKITAPGAQRALRAGTVLEWR
ncbi:hypothetical protein [Streptomyces boncukensis]|uniref:Lipoprotein n=1 Tax=Streptomyces boncukensis TaxID=2711219 RepID=A0A6G4WZD0_9ACTN|nr:hypothetical protein [Streptomyces boncukensis]NGO69990.1 hypothetical protein [Streptomyces boncukensis]